MEGIKRSILVVAAIIFCGGLSDGAQLKDHDLLVANGNSIMFFQNSSLNATRNLPLAANTAKDQKTRIKWIASDIQSDTIYFTSVESSGVSISSYSLKTNQTTEIYWVNGTRGVVEELSLYKNHLYWRNRPSLSVMRLEITIGDENQKSKVPEVVFTDANSTLGSFTISPEDGSIYYTNWKRGQESQILVYTGLRNGTLGRGECLVFAENLWQPDGLYADASHLYWTANPPGVYYSIERAPFEDPGKIEVLHKNSGRHPFSMAVNCSREIFFTDTRNKVLWKLNLKNDTLTNIKYFRNEDPGGVILISQAPSTCEDVKKEGEASACSGLTCDKVMANNSASEDAKYSDTKDNFVSPTMHMLLVKNCTSQENSCLNGASCLKIDGRIFCLWQDSAVNSKPCAENTSEASGPVVSSPSKEHLHNQSSALSSWSSSTDPFLICSSVLSGVVVLLIIVVVVLLIKVRKLDRKPRIRRRVVVSHRSDMDCNPSPSSSSVCEMIDIENCCNMNVCETPCYERVTGGSGSSSSSGTISFGRSRKNSVKEDKKCLISS